MTDHKAGVRPGANVPWNYSSHKRVAGGVTKSARNMDALRERSDALDLPMWMMSNEEFERVFSEVSTGINARRKQKT